ncbi:hypothetical protein DH2020_038547 [Rehmannia glutinosa]|uniref:WAT1-related protein n=1 Tax=Rehmannia glutinosa TaxID=99300 RepID=A0ABR0UZX3_REHGL
MNKTSLYPNEFYFSKKNKKFGTVIVGFHIVSRVALNIGVSKVVYPVYRNIIALLLLGPFAYFIEKKDRPPLTFSLLAQFFLLALVGITANQGFYILGLYYASPTFASAMQNSVPAITFIMASALRLEQVSLTRIDGVAKILGTVASVGGAMIITLYKGPPILNQTSETEGSNSVLVSSNKVQNWTWGCIFLLGHCLSWAGWMVLQGVISSGLVISLQTWCIQKGGPVFVASFQPVQTVLVAGMAFVILGDQLYSGGVIGAVLIMIGLYLVLWGKTAETRYQSKDTEETLTKHLLEGNNNDQENPDRNDVP